MSIASVVVYKRDFCQMLIKHLKEGLSFASFGGVVGVSEKTLYKWADTHEDFKEAKEVGTTASRLFYEKILRNTSLGINETEMNGKTITLKPNAACLIFTLKNRFGYRDNPDPETEGEENYPEVG